MKWLCGLLIVANVALYLWVTQHPHQVDSGMVSAEEPVNTQSMELLEEFNAGRSSTEPLHCARLGPFATEDTFLNGQQLLINAGFASFTRKVINARELRVSRVFAGPFSSELELQSALEDLHRLGFDPHLYEDAAGKVLTVKMFSQEEAAGRFKVQLENQGIEVQARPERRTLGPLRWLELPSVITDEQRRTLRQIDWRDAMTKVSIVPCLGTSSGVSNQRSQ